MPRIRVAKAHGVRLVPGSLLATIAGSTEITVNSLHNQGVDRLAPRLVAEGWAPDGTVEAVRVRDATGFAYGVQWHPEYDWERDAISRVAGAFRPGGGSLGGAAALAASGGIAAPNNEFTCGMHHPCANSARQGRRVRRIR